QGRVHDPRLRTGPAFDRRSVLERGGEGGVDGDPARAASDPSASSPAYDSGADRRLFASTTQRTDDELVRPESPALLGNVQQSRAEAAGGCVDWSGRGLRRFLDAQYDGDLLADYASDGGARREVCALRGIEKPRDRDLYGRARRRRRAVQTCALDLLRPR